MNTSVVELYCPLECVVASSPTLEESYLSKEKGCVLTATRVKEVLSNQRGFLHQGRGPKDPSVRRGRDPRTLASRYHSTLRRVLAIGVRRHVEYVHHPEKTATRWLG